MPEMNIFHSVRCEMFILRVFFYPRDHFWFFCVAVDAKLSFQLDEVILANAYGILHPKFLPLILLIKAFKGKRIRNIQGSFHPKSETEKVDHSLF